MGQALGHEHIFSDDNKNKVFRWECGVASRTLEETAFILCGKRMLQLNRVGTEIWELFCDGSTLDHAVQYVVRRYGLSLEQARVDVQDFVEALMRRNLLQTA